MNNQNPKYCPAGKVICERKNCHGLSNRELAKFHVCPWPDLQMIMEGNRSKTVPALHSTTDARIWAREFLKIFPNGCADFMCMVGWFANAIMAGYDSYPKNATPSGMKIETVSASSKDSENVGPMVGA